MSWPLRYSTVQSNKDRADCVGQQSDETVVVIYYSVVASMKSHEYKCLTSNNFPFSSSFSLPSSFCAVSSPFASLPLQLLTGLLSDHLPAFIFSGPAFGLQAVVDLILVDSEKPAFSL
jgi:hypothetical protein